MIEGLGAPENARALAHIRAAVRLGVRPSVFRHEWSTVDRLAVLALFAHDDEQRAKVHGPCGQPIEQAFNPEAEGWFEAYGVQCQACAALAEYEETHSHDRSRGVVTYVVNTMAPGDIAALPPWQLPHVADLAALHHHD